ncbi:MAG: SpoIIE family protein phosphatase [Thermodesulfobacteriota bacterium]
MADNILIVDDNEVNRLLLSKIVEEAGFNYCLAVDGDEAVFQALAETPDLILLDIMMPGKDGYQACSEIKSHPTTANIPIIFLSAMGHSEDKIKGLELGGTDYVTKPFNAGELLARVNTQLKIKHLTEDILRANRDLCKKQRALDADLQSAAEIQKSLLPAHFANSPGLDIAWQFQPCDAVGGDIFDIYRLDEEHWAFYMLDVSGHGVPSAMITVSVQQQLQPSTGLLVKKNIAPPPYYEIIAPSEVLTKLDKEYPIDRFDRYFTIVYMILNVKTGHLVYSGAAHPPPVLLRNDGDIELLKEGGTIIGMDGIVPFEQGEELLQPGDTLYLYTDGIPEYRNNRGEFYTDDRLYEEIRQKQDSPPSQATAEIVKTVIHQFGDNNPPQDDISLLSIKYLGNGTPE